MRQLTPQQRRLLAIGAAAVVVLLYFVALLMPLTARGRELSSERESLNGAIERSQMMDQAAQAARDDVAALRGEIQALMFPEGDVRVNMVRQLERLAVDTGLTITSIRPEEPEMADGAVKYPATFQVEADFSDLVLLMFELEQPARRLWVEGVEISAGRQVGGRLQATFYVAAYAEAEEAEARDAQA
jgi:Tfp pilus assembly protein PilO